MKTYFKKNIGVTLLELLLVLGVIMAITVQKIEGDVREAEQQSARMLGNEVFQYTNGVRAYIAENYDQLVTTDIPGAAGSLTLAGTAYLKDASCTGGTGAIKYVPCTIGNNTRLGNMLYSITLTESAGVITGQNDLGPLVLAGNIRQDLASIAALTAAGISLNGGNPTQNSTTATFLTDARQGIPAASRLAPFGSIRYIIDQNGTSDAWLRVDGSNDMEADISFDPANGAASRGIVNLARLANTNTSAANDQIAFESAIEFTGAAGTHAIENVDIISNALGGDVQIDDTLNVTGAAQFDLTINATDEITSQVAVDAPIFRDLDNTSYYADPATTSVFNRLDVDEIYEGPDANDFILFSADRLHFQGNTVAEQRWTGLIDARNLQMQIESGYAGAGVADNTEALAHSLPRFVNKGIFRVADSDFVRKPICPSGVPAIKVDIASVGFSGYVPLASSTSQYGTYYRIYCRSSDPTVCGTAGRIYARAIDAGANWQILIGSSVNKAGLGTQYGLVTVYCRNY